MSFPKVVVVTGASAGVGRATVRALAARGAHLGLIARGKEGLEGAKKEVEACGGRAVAISADVSKAGQVERAAERIEQELGPIDVWVNNAMVTVVSPVKKMLPEEFERVTEVTYLGFVYGTLSALRRMLPRNRGVIVQVGSALAHRSIPLQSAYCAAKHAIVGFTESLRCELLHDRSKVKVTVVHMPGLNTPQFGWAKTRMPRQLQPVPPIFQPEVAARAIVHAIEHPRREIWVGMPTVKAILGNRFIAGWLDRYLAWRGYRAQQTDGPISAERSDNLFYPVPGDHGAHGTFDARSRSRSPQLWAAMNRRALTMLGLGAATLLGAWLGSRRIA